MPRRRHAASRQRGKGWPVVHSRMRTFQPARSTAFPSTLRGRYHHHPLPPRPLPRCSRPPLFHSHGRMHGPVGGVGEILTVVGWVVPAGHHGRGGTHPCSRCSHCNRSRPPGPLRGNPRGHCRGGSGCYCSFGLGECGIFEIELYGLQSWYTASLCHHNGAAKRNFDESPLWSS